MGSNNGTGQPITFDCHMCRRRCRDMHHDGTRLRVFHTCDHTQVRTGRTRPYRGGNRGPRGLMVHHEYVCTCGHRGWSRISGVQHLLLEEA